MKKIMAFILIISIIVVNITTSAVLAENEDNAIKFFDSENGIGRASGGKTAPYGKERTEVYVAEPGNTVYFYADNTSTVAADIISFDFCESNTGVFGYFELFGPAVDESKSYFERYKRTVFLNDKKFMYFATFDGGGVTQNCKIHAPIIKPGEWRHVDICIDYEENSAIIYYDGKYQGEVKLPESYVSCGGIRYVNENKGTNSIVYLDNVRMNHIKQKGFDFELDSDITYPDSWKFVNITNENIGSIFFDSKIKYNLEFINNYDKDADYKVTANVLNENKYIEQTFEKGISCKAMDKSAMPLEFEVKDKGFYTLELNIYNSVTGKSVVERKEFSVATLNEEPNKKYGVCNHFNQFHGISEADRKTELFVKAGFSKLRDEANWRNVEKTKGVLKLPETEVIKRNAEDKYGMDKYVLLLGANPKITGENTPISPETIKKFADYAGFMAENNKDRNACYEVWNEYNHVPFNKDNGTVSDYINLLKATYTKIKSIDPSATVYGMGGVTYIANLYDWIEEFLQLGGQQYCDGFSFHPYTPSGNAFTAVDVFNKCYDLFKKYGCEDKKLSISEIGWTKPDELQQQQADYEIQFAAMVDDKVDNLMWYVSQMKESESVSENNFGMIRAWDKEWAEPYEPYSARPVFLAHANYNKLMNKATDKREITSSDSDISAFMYKTNDGKSMIICWNNAQSKKDVSIKLDAENVSVYDINGTQNDYTLVNNTISIELDNSPKYIKGDFTDVEFVDEQMFSVSTKSIETTPDDKITLSLSNKSNVDAQIEIEAPVNMTVEKNDGFVNNNAEIVLSTGNTKIKDSALRIKILSGENLIKEYILPVTYKDTASASVLASYLRAGRWQYKVKITNNKAIENISGKVIVSKPENISVSEKTLEFGDIIPLASKNLYINIPSNLVDVKTEFDGKVVLSTGEEYPLKSNIYFSSIVYTDKQPKIDGVIDKDEWFTRAPFKLMYKSQVVQIEKWKGVGDVGGNAYCMYDKDNFYICAEITDNILGDNDKEERIWANDSIQFAFAPEREKNGTRTEYGIGLVNGESKIERYSFVTVDTEIIGMHDNNDFSALRYVVKRDEENKKTIYEAKIPWTEIYGSDFNIFRYDSLYFSMLVNDNDKEGRRGWIEFCPGIGYSKDPSQFIDVLLLKKGRMIGMY